jgi:hypothetical protein
VTVQTKVADDAEGLAMAKSEVGKLVAAGCVVTDYDDYAKRSTLNCGSWIADISYLDINKTVYASAYMGTEFECTK